MRSLRPEQIFLLVLFVLVPLLNLLVRWLQRRAREQPRRRPAAPRAPEPAPREEWPPTAMPPRVRVIEPPLPREGPRKAPAAPPPPPARRRRPLGGRLAVRQAVIAMTILGPCRGLEEPPGPATPAPRPVPSRRP